MPQIVNNTNWLDSISKKTSPVVIIVSGLSGDGKGHLIKELCKGKNCVEIDRGTTRAQRPGEPECRLSSELLFSWNNFDNTYGYCFKELCNEINTSAILQDGCHIFVEVGDIHKSLIAQYKLREQFPFLPLANLVINHSLDTIAERLHKRPAADSEEIDTRIKTNAIRYPLHNNGHKILRNVTPTLKVGHQRLDQHFGIEDLDSPEIKIAKFEYLVEDARFLSKKMLHSLQAKEVDLQLAEEYPELFSTLYSILKEDHQIPEKSIMVGGVAVGILTKTPLRPISLDIDFCSPNDLRITDDLEKSKRKAIFHSKKTQQLIGEVEIDLIFISRIKPLNSTFCFQFLKTEFLDNFSINYTLKGREFKVAPRELLLFQKLVAARGIDIDKYDLHDSKRLIETSKTPFNYELFLHLISHQETNSLDTKFEIPDNLQKDNIFDFLSSLGFEDLELIDILITRAAFDVETEPLINFSLDPNHHLFLPTINFNKKSLKQMALIDRVISGLKKVKQEDIDNQTENKINNMIKNFYYIAKSAIGRNDQLNVE